jgi:hypothetical protein
LEAKTETNVASYGCPDLAMAKACIYFKKLSNINISIIEELSSETITYLNKHHECAYRDKKRQ